MPDRGMIKWMPFNSVINGNILVNSIEKEKARISKPILSEEQIEIIQDNILESMINKVSLIFTIYQSGFIKEIKGTVINIDSIKKKIYLDNHKYLYFREIISVLICNMC